MYFWGLTNNDLIRLSSLHRFPDVYVLRRMSPVSMAGPNSVLLLLCWLEGSFASQRTSKLYFFGDKYPSDQRDFQFLCKTFNIFLGHL